MLQAVSGQQMSPVPHIDAKDASATLDLLIDYVANLLPVTAEQYPSIASLDEGAKLEFCLRHSALHFSKTAGRLAAFVEDADHGKFAEIDALQAIVAASLVNSLKLADEIGLTGPDILEQIREKFPELEAGE